MSGGEDRWTRGGLDAQLVAELEGSVVVGFDGSEHADRAVRWAAEQAALEHRRLVVIGAEDVTGEAVDGAAAAVRATHPSLDVVDRATPREARQVLLDASEHAFLLAVGSRGLGAFRSALLGSVSAAVARHASCPVVVCRPTGTTRDSARAGVVVGADGTRESLPVVEFAYRQAYLRHLPLTVLHTVVGAAAAVALHHGAGGETVPPPGSQDLGAALALSVAGLDRDYPGVAVTISLERGLAEELLAPRDDGWELVVVGRHPMTSLDRLLITSVSIAVLERARCTVAVVPESARPRPDPGTPDA